MRSVVSWTGTALVAVAVKIGDCSTNEPTVDGTTQAILLFALEAGEDR